MTYAMRRIMTICEMALPTDAMRTNRYYHGTGTTASAEAILASGLKGVDQQQRGLLAPIAGRVYLTPDIVYAIIYALGGDYRHAMLEGPHELPDGTIDPLGYVFVIEGRDLQDVQPDEDSVGGFLADNSEPTQEPWRKRDGTIALKPDGQPYMRTISHTCAIGDDDPVGRQIYYYIQSRVTKSQFKRIVGGEIAYHASGGKRALKQMPDWMKIELINRGAHIAHGGSIQPSECWRIIKNQVNKLKKDGSNFFQIAERIR